MDPSYFLSEEELTFFQKTLQLSSLHFSLKKEWGSQNPSHRDQIHQALSDLLSAKNKEADDSANIQSYSVSHTLDLGGFAYVTLPWKIGLDLEQQDRVLPAVAARVCRNQSEFENAPSAQALWTAKESAFKALRGPLQPSTISSITIGNWTGVNSYASTFQILNSSDFQIEKGLGLTYSKAPFQIAIFVCQNPVAGK